MVFSSPVFLFQFLPLTLLLVMMAANRRAQNTVLLIASLLFYAWGEGVFTLLMLAIVLVNHLCGLALERFQDRRAWLVFAVVVNVGVLIWFKYVNLFVDTINSLLLGIGLTPIAIDPVHLPIGVSFFIFHALSYVVDVYRNKVSAQQSPGISTLYIAFFPQLVAGPIIRYHDVADQFNHRVLDLDRFTSGIRRFVTGLAKKVLIADQVARIADAVFAVPVHQQTTAVAWLGLVAYAVQIYFDFSGYSDMAIGLGRMFGFSFLENFNRPYIARSIREFWQRWHISLSNWFRDYLYIPLGGNRKGPLRTYLNLFLVFFITGLWHGASWNFVVWGLLHGGFMVLERVGLGRLLDRSPRIIGHLYTLLVVLSAWVFFRIDDFGTATRFLGTLFGLHGGDGQQVYPWLFLTNAGIVSLVIGILGSLNAHMLPTRWLPSVFAFPSTHRGVHGVIEAIGVLALFFLVAMAVASSTFSPFIYFRF